MNKSPTQQEPTGWGPYEALSPAGVADGHGQVFWKRQSAMAEEQLKAFLEKVTRRCCD
ncbi:hypothetical protein MITS9508_02272 [Synechococcus sp. MIT S9508]|nr:hypothetical protein MITS9508_02272 [Synechococcus sp. MIT S9508]